MHRNKALKMGLSTLIIVLLSMGMFAFVNPVSAGPTVADPPWEYPRLNELYYIAAYPEAHAQEMALACDIEMTCGIIDPDNVEKLAGLGWNVSASPGFHMCFICINSRDVVPPPTVGMNYHGRGAGWRLWPLNVTSFRWALRMIICPLKAGFIEELYRFINVPVNNVIPPAQATWYEPMPCPNVIDPRTPEEVLNADGFYRCSCDGGTGWFHVGPDGTPCTGDDREINERGNFTETGIRENIYMSCPEEAPISCELVHRCVTALNNYFGTNCQGGDYFVWEPMPFYSEIYVMFYDRSHDMMFICYGFDRFPTWLYYEYASDLYPWTCTGTEEYEISNKLNGVRWCEMLNGTRVDTMPEMIALVHDVAWDIYFESPWIPLYSRKYHDAYMGAAVPCNPREGRSLINVVESPGYGSCAYQLPWTWTNMHWETASGSNKPGINEDVRFGLGGPVSTLHPGEATSVYEVHIVNRMYDSLFETNPYDHTDIPWLATHWETGDWGAEGSYVKFWLRDDVYWQDGRQFTSADLIWNWNFVCDVVRDCPGTITASDYEVFCDVYAGATAICDTIVEIYFNVPNCLWNLYSVPSAIFPKPVWERFYNATGGIDCTAFEMFHPEDILYEDWTHIKPTPPHCKDYQCTPDPEKDPTYDHDGDGKSDLTCLYGTGPFWFDYWNSVTESGRIVRWDCYWIQDPIYAAKHTDNQCTITKQETVDKIIYPVTFPRILQPCQKIFIDKHVKPETVIITFNGEPVPPGGPPFAWELISNNATDEWYLHILTGIELVPENFIDAHYEKTCCYPKNTKTCDVEVFVNLLCGNAWYGPHFTQPEAEAFARDEMHIEYNQTAEMLQPEPGDPVVVESGSNDLDPFEVWSERSPLPLMEPGVYKWTKTAAYNTFDPPPPPPTPLPRYVPNVISGVATYSMIAGYLPGDANCDCKVNMRDIGAACLAYGSFAVIPPTPQHPRWNKGADINCDDKVNMRDIGTMCLMYGQTLGA